MAEALVYLTTLALFSYVIMASALMKHDMMTLACIPPVFVALIMGFVMAIYAEDAFGIVPTAAASVLGVPAAWWVAGRYSPRDLLLGIYLAWALGMVFALAAFGFPDRG